MDPETFVFQAANSEDVMILAYTIFDWSICVTDRQTNRQTELRWLRCAIVVPAVMRKNQWNVIYWNAGI